MSSFKNTPLNHKLLSLLLLLIGCGNFTAQDTLYFSNSTKETIVLLEVNPDNIKYKKFDNQSGPTYTKLKTDLEHVVYKNGVKENFVQIEKQESKQETAKPKEVSEPEKDPMADFFNGDKPDTILFRSGKKTIGKVLIVNNTEVKYKLWDYQDGPTYQASKSELSSIHSGRGKVMDMTQSDTQISIDAGARPVTQTSNSNNSNDNSGNYSSSNNSGNYSNYNNGYNQQLYTRGISDAKKYYTHNGGSIGVGCAGAGCGPLIGLIPAVIVSENEPRDANLGVPPSAYSNDKDYMRGYKEEAYRMKKRKVWRGYGIGAGSVTAIILAFYIVIIALSI